MSPGQVLPLTARDYVFNQPYHLYKNVSHWPSTVGWPTRSPVSDRRLPLYLLAKLTPEPL